MRNYIKQLRINAGMTQSQTAHKLDISESYYNLIENGSRQKDMTLTMAGRLATALGTSTEYILQQEQLLAIHKAG